MEAEGLYRKWNRKRYRKIRNTYAKSNIEKPRKVTNNIPSEEILITNLEMVL